MPTAASKHEWLLADNVSQEVHLKTRQDGGIVILVPSCINNMLLNVFTKYSYNGKMNFKKFSAMVK